MKKEVLLFSFIFCIFFVGRANAQEKDVFIGSAFNTGASAYVIIDVEENSLLLGKNSYDVRPIASLTKLMTAIVALDNGFDFGGNMTYDSKKHYAYKNYMGFQNGDVIENRDLWTTMLAGSMNVPARMIVDSLGFSEKEFIDKMNKKAEMLGLYDMRFVDVHGLSHENVGSAMSIAKLFIFANSHPSIKQALLLKNYEFDELASVDAKYHHSFSHSNRLLKQDLQIKFGPSKTGYLTEAGPCIVFETSISGEDLVIVALNEPSWNYRGREAYKLALWWKNLSLAQKMYSKPFAVKYQDSPDVYEVSSIGKVLISNEWEFLQKGYSWSDIITIGRNDRIKIGQRLVVYPVELAYKNK